MNKFPKEFLWGASTSSHQVEGNNYYNDWWHAEQSGKTHPSGQACDHYNRFREDLSLAKELGHNAHRLGIEWSRLERSEGIWDEDEWQHYKDVLQHLRSSGIEPVVTINHFTIPLWLAQKGGWENDCIVEIFSRFAVKAIKELGEFTQYWIPINEPQVLAFIAYFKGHWPPYKNSFDDMLFVTKNMLKAHAAAYYGMKLASEKNKNIMTPIIGVAKAVAAFHPCSRYSVLDNISTFLRTRFQDHAFIESAITGKIRFFPYISGTLPQSRTVDFIGLNYYFREFVHNQYPIWKNPFGWICSRSHHFNAGKRTTMDWEIYPRGLYEVVKKFSKYDLPIMITENGLSTLDDNVRKEYIHNHLSWLLKAIDEDCPVTGYLHWSLLDNFEWAEGFDPRFGLIEVDYKTQKRRIRDSARYYAQIIRTGVIPGNQ